MVIAMKTANVLELLKEHKENHVKEFTLQVQGWKTAMEKWQKDLAAWTKSTSENACDETTEQRPQEPAKPRSFVADYDKFIELVENHVEENINLDEYEFNQIVKDEFNWRHTFQTNSLLYSNNF